MELTQTDKKKKIVGDPRRTPVDWKPQNMQELVKDIDRVLGQCKICLADGSIQKRLDLSKGVYDE